jgi:hypothetical protein
MIDPQAGHSLSKEIRPPKAPAVGAAFGSSRKRVIDQEAKERSPSLVRR